MEWIKDKKTISGIARVPIKSWCPEPEPEALQQAANLAAHNRIQSDVNDVREHVGLEIKHAVADKQG